MCLVAAWVQIGDIEYIVGRPYLLTDEGTPLSAIPISPTGEVSSLIIALHAGRRAPICDGSPSWAVVTRPALRQAGNLVADPRRIHCMCRGWRLSSPAARIVCQRFPTQRQK